jgi:hypothetical protein
VTKLHQVNALLTSRKTRAQRNITDAHHTLQRTPLLSGVSRSYRPRDDEGEQLPPENNLVQTRVDQVLDQVAAEMVSLFDLQVCQDLGNAEATADVIVGGGVLLTKVPVTFLLFLDKRLADLRTIVEKLPVLDASEEWSWDEARMCWRSAPATTFRSKKVQRNHVLSEATDRHPAQVQVFSEDVPVGTWTTVKLSGAVPATRRRALLARVDALIDAVRVAREAANEIEVPAVPVGQRVMAYLFAE